MYPFCLYTESNLCVDNEGGYTCVQGRDISEIARACSVMSWPRSRTRISHIAARILEWAAGPFSRGSSWPRDWTQISHIAGRFLTVWATMEAQRALVPLSQPGVELEIFWSVVRCVTRCATGPETGFDTYYFSCVYPFSLYTETDLQVDNEGGCTCVQGGDIQETARVCSIVSWPR